MNHRHYRDWARRTAAPAQAKGHLMSSLLAIMDRISRRMVCLLVGHDWRPVWDGSTTYDACNHCEASRGVRQ